LLIRSGQADVVLAGGADACLTFGTLRAWEAMRVLAGEACRPFSANRQGLVLGEAPACSSSNRWPTHAHAVRPCWVCWPVSG
jgi:3-oxoacyl-(acyl-carrier-protein) synthase